MTAVSDFEEQAELLRVLGHGVRLALLASLVPGERTVGDIEIRTGVGQPLLSQQLGVLRKAGLVLTRRQAKLVYYQIDHARIASLITVLEGFGRPVRMPGRPDDDRWASATAGAAAAFARIGPVV